MGTEVSLSMQCSWLNVWSKILGEKSAEASGSFDSVPEMSAACDDAIENSALGSGFIKTGFVTP